MVIGVQGYKRSGKDTIADHLVNSYNFERYSFANPIKEACKHLFGFTDEQVYGDLKDVVDYNWNITPRYALQIMGTEIFQYDIQERIPELKVIGRTHWVKRFEMWYNDQLILQNEMNNFENDGTFHVVIPDVRFQHEVDGIRKVGGKIIKVIRPGLPLNDAHPSEMEQNAITDIDYIVMNDSDIPALYKKMDEIMLDIRTKK